MTLQSLSRTIKRRVLPCAAVSVMPLFFGGWFKWLSGPQSTFDTQGPVAKAQLEVFYTTLWVTGITFVIVASIMAYAMLKFRARKTDDAKAAIPPQGHGNPLIELGLIGLSVLALVFIAVPTLKAVWYSYDVPEAEQASAYEVNATGYQWWFKFEYTNEMVKLPTGGEAPLLTGNELVVPAGRPVRVHVRTVDVIHSFWVPKLAGKVDMIPNRANFLWVKADEPGYFWGQCAEYCGDSHAVMRFRVVALGKDEFNLWLEDQKKTARALQAPAIADANAPKAQFASYRAPEDFRLNEAGVSERFETAPLDKWREQQQATPKTENLELIAKGKATFNAKTCIACHTIRGHQGAQGITGPDLTHVGARTTIAAGLLENNPEQLRRWLHNPGAVKPGNKMAKGFADNGIKLNADDEVALVAYLESLK